MVELTCAGARESKICRLSERVQAETFAVREPLGAFLTTTSLDGISLLLKLDVFVP